jgi:mRNA-degrading endonuclease YafQ of YafQ-DinJ toxin-antitoxin module
MEIKYLDEFNKEFKRLTKKYKSLEKDFDIFLMALKIDPT